MLAYGPVKVLYHNVTRSHITDESYMGLSFVFWVSDIDRIVVSLRIADIPHMLPHMPSCEIQDS